MKWIIILLLCRIHGCLGQPLTPEQEQNLRDFVSATMSCRMAAGLSLSLVRNGETIFADGFGLRDVNNNLPMLASTRTNIGSVTKSFTSSLCAHAVSRGLVTWDQPLREVLGPDFGMEGPFRTAQLSLRDALAHKIGLPNYWGVTTAGMNVTKEELCMERLKYFPTIYDFRSRYIYSNYPLVLAAYVQEVVTNQTWDDYLTGVLLGPLNMDRTRTASQLTEEDWLETSYSYIVQNDTFVQNPEQDQLPFIEEISPAGGLFSTAEDMAEWLKFHIRNGKTGSGQIIIPSDILAETHTAMFASSPESPKIQKPAFPVENTQRTTGMGWFQGMYRGYEKIDHTGSYSSYTCKMSILTEMSVGAWVCVNSPGDNRGYDAVETVNIYGLDLLLDVTPWLNVTTTCTYPAPWVTQDSATATLTEKVKPLEHDPEYVTPLNRPSANSDYVGEYYHPAFGTFYISENATDKRLVYKFGMLLSGDLNPSGTADTYYMTLDHPLTYRMAFYPSYPDGFPVYFRRNDNDSSVINVEVPYFEFDLPPVFNKQNVNL